MRTSLDLFFLPACSLALTCIIQVPSLAGWIIVDWVVTDFLGFGTTDNYAIIVHTKKGARFPGSGLGKIMKNIIKIMEWYNIERR